MALRFTFAVDGARELMATCHDPKLIGVPVGRALTAMALEIERKAKVNATTMGAVDTGLLRAKITHRLEAASTPSWAEIGVKAKYAVPVHEGRRPNAKMPPPAALRGWAQRHGIPTTKRVLFLIARKIGRRGIPARPFLRRAFEDVSHQAERYLRQAAQGIEARWQRPG